MENIKFKTSFFGYKKETVLSVLKDLIRKNSESEKAYKENINYLKKQVENLEAEKKEISLKYEKIKEFENAYRSKKNELTDLLIEIKRTKEDEINSAKQQGKEIIENINREIAILKNEKDALEKEINEYRMTVFNQLKSDLVEKKKYIDKVISVIEESTLGNISKK